MNDELVTKMKMLESLFNDRLSMPAGVGWVDRPARWTLGPNGGVVFEFSTTFPPPSSRVISHGSVEFTRGEMELPEKGLAELAHRRFSSWLGRYEVRQFGNRAHSSRRARRGVGATKRRRGAR